MDFCLLAFVMTGGRSRRKTTSVSVTSEQHEDVGHEEESGGFYVEDQEDEQDSLKREVKDLSSTLNQVIGEMAKLTKQTSAPGILQEEVGAQSTPINVSGDSDSSESVVPVYSGDRLALCVGREDINLEHEPQFRHLSHQWNHAFERTLWEGSASVKPTDRHNTNVSSCVTLSILLL
jgi:hypothetical protein